MATPYLGEIRVFGFGFAPRGWALCNGQTLRIAQYQALFSLLGTTYGGDGTTTFQLPNLQGRVAPGTGTSSFGTSFVLGQVLGEATHTLTQAEIPAHNHTIAANANGTANATNIPGASVIPGSGSSGGPGTPVVNIYANSAPSSGMLPLGNAGAGQPHENRMPYGVLNYCIALDGIFPTRN